MSPLAITGIFVYECLTATIFDHARILDGDDHLAVAQLDGQIFDHVRILDGDDF